MTEYELLTQGASHSLAPAYDGRDPMRNRPLLNGSNTSMTINRYGLGRAYIGNTGSPSIVGRSDGEYVRHDDHAALISELQAELAGVERIVVARTVTIAELRVDHSGDANDMVDAPVPSDPVAWRIDYTCPRNCGSVVYHGHNAIADYWDIDPNATSTPLFEQPPTSAQLAVSAEPAPNEDAIYLGCARMGLAEASDDEVLSFVRIAKQRASAPTPSAEGNQQ